MGRKSEYTIWTWDSRKKLGDKFRGCVYYVYHDTLERMIGPDEVRLDSFFPLTPESKEMLRMLIPELDISDLEKAFSYWEFKQDIKETPTLHGWKYSCGWL